MLRFALAIAGLLASSCVFAQSEREEAHAQFAKDLAELQQTVQIANGTLPAFQGGMPLGQAIVSRDTIAHELPSTASDAAASLSRGSEVELLGGSGAWTRVLAKDEGGSHAVWVQSDALTAQTRPLSDGLLDAILRQARQIVDQYRANPYVEVVGFSGTLGFTGISLTVEFRLK